jgi:PTH1 family peptidyl-tRNA hydrolase
MAQPIDLIAGLGNPDPEYLTTRHNAGFWFVDALAARHGGVFSTERKFEGDIAEVEISGRRIRLLKPMTYMNHSGRSLAKAINYYKTPLDHVLVVYDELDLAPGRVKLKFDGGHAGHNGMRSVIEHVGAALWRIRIGVGHPGPGRKDQVVGHVLRKASAVEEQLILDGIRDALDSIPVLIEKGPELAKNRLHAARGNNDDGKQSEKKSD